LDSPSNPKGSIKEKELFRDNSKKKSMEACMIYTIIIILVLLVILYLPIYLRRRGWEKHTFIDIEALDIIVIGGAAYRKWGKDVDIRIQVPYTKALVTFPKETSSEIILRRCTQLINTKAICELISDLIEKDVPVDGGLTIYVGKEKKTVFFNTSFKFTHIDEFRKFPWCYYIQRGRVSL
jgi:hypothetical protein